VVAGESGRQPVSKRASATIKESVTLIKPSRSIPFICQGISVRRPSTKKQLAIFGIWDLNPGPKCRLKSSHHSTTSPPPPQQPCILYTNLPAGLQCELPRLFGGNSHSDAACNFCPDQLGCVWLPRPVRVHRLPRKLGLRAAAPIVRVECGRGVG
jgi:hypothetical protein